MRVVVTGAAGFIGSHLCEALLADGHAVVGIDCFVDYYDRSQKEANLAGARDAAAFELHEVDLRCDPLESVIDGADAVVNEAGMPGLRLSWDHFELYVSCNLLGLERLISACKATNVRTFVQASTSSVYGAHAVGDETQPTKPVSPYGVTKLAAEQLLLAHVASFNFPATVLRYFSIYGPRQRPDMAYRRFIAALSAGDEITVYGDGQQSRSNTFVDDCVRGTVQALYAGQPGEIYNIGGGHVLTLLEAIDIIASELKVAPRVRFEPRIAGDQHHTSADVTKATAAFGYQPITSVAQGLKRQIAWQVGTGTYS